MVCIDWILLLGERCNRFYIPFIKSSELPLGWVGSSHASNHAHLKARVSVPRVMKEISSVYMRLKIKIRTKELVKCVPSSSSKYSGPELKYLNKHASNYTPDLTT